MDTIKESARDLWAAMHDPENHNKYNTLVEALQAQRDDMRELAAKEADAHFGAVYEKLRQLVPDLEEGKAMLPQRIRDLK